MAIALNVYSGPYTANGSQTTFPFDFTAASACDVSVLVNGVAAASTLYTVTINADGTGSVTFSVAPTFGSLVVPVLDPDFTQETFYENEGAYKLSTINSTNRRDAIKAVFMRDAALRAIRVPFGETTPMLPARASRAGKFLAFDGDGNAYGAGGTGSDPGLRGDLAAVGGGALVTLANGQTLAQWFASRGRRVSLEAAGITPWTALDPLTGVPTGAYPDHAPAFQALATALGALGGGVIDCTGSVGTLIFRSTVLLPLGVSIDFPSARKRPVRDGVRYWAETLRIMPHPLGSFYTGAAVGEVVSVASSGNCQAGYLFMANLDPTVSVTDYQYAGGIPGIGTGYIRNLRVYGITTGGISICRAAGAFQGFDWAGEQVATALSWIPSLYTDYKTAHRFSFDVRANATSPLIDARGTGDGLDISVVECGKFYGTSPASAAQGVWVSNCRGGRVFGLINGIHQFNNSICDVSGMHIELGQFQLDGFQGTIRDGQLFNGGNMLTPIVVSNASAGSGDRRSFNVSNLRFVHQVNWLAFGATGWATTEKLDILFDTGSSGVEVMDDGTSRRVVGANGVLDKTTSFAPRIGTSGGPFADLVNYGAMIQRRPCSYGLSKAPPVTGVMEIAGTLGAITATTYTASSASFAAPTGTYFYQAQIMPDPVRRIGRGITGSPAAVSVAATNGSSTLPQINFDLTGFAAPGGFNIRLYRGSSNGNYDKYVDLPAACLSYGWDDGNCFASFPWISRTAGAEDTVMSGYTGTTARLVYESGYVVVKGATGTSIPTVGTWKQSDKTELQAQTADANSMVLEGSTCTVAGSPGTWVNRRFSTVSPAV